MSEIYTVIGANGFVGREIVKSLKSQDLKVYTPEKGSTDLYTRPLGKVFYCAGYTSDYLDDVSLTIEAHVNQLVKILNHADYQRLVYLSSTRLYDGCQTQVAYENSLISLNTYNDRSIYDLSKGLGESLCFALGGSKAAVARLSCVYSNADQSPGFLSKIFNEFKINNKIVRNSSILSERDYIYIGDVVLALRAILDSDLSEVFNVASGENISNLQLKELFSKYGLDIGFNGIENDEVQNSLPRCDNTKIKELGVFPKTFKEFLIENLNLV